MPLRGSLGSKPPYHGISTSALLLCTTTTTLCIGPRSDTYRSCTGMTLNGVPKVVRDFSAFNLNICKTYLKVSGIFIIYVVFLWNGVGDSPNEHPVFCGFAPFVQTSELSRRYTPFVFSKRKLASPQSPAATSEMKQPELLQMLAFLRGKTISYPIM